MKRSLVLLLALGACVAPPKAPPPQTAAPRPALAPVLPPPPPVAWEDRARTAGNWTLSGDVASFGPAAGAALLSLRCAGQDVVITYPAAQAGPMVLRTTTLGRTLALAPGGIARIAANDPLLDAIVYTRGRFMVSAAGQPDLIIPPWPEIARVVEDCRH